MVCEGSTAIQIVSDYNVTIKKARCEACGKVIKISFPNKDKPNLAKFSRHSRKEIK